MTTRRIVLIIGFVACFSTLVPLARRVWAQNAVEKRFDQLDRNCDGKITPDELPAAVFDRLDKDQDGFVTPEEVKSLRKTKT